jgi:hypothetical protein
MTSLLLTWTGIWNFIGKAFQWLFQFMPSMGFTINLMVWIIIAVSFFYWLYKQSADTKKARAEGRLI